MPLPCLPVPAIAIDEQDRSGSGNNTTGEHQKGIARCWPNPWTHEELQRRMWRAGDAQTRENKREAERHKQEEAVLPECKDGRGSPGATLSSHKLAKGIGGCSKQRQQGRRFKQARAGFQHHTNANQPDEHRTPHLCIGPFAQIGPGKNRNKQWHGKIQRHGIGQRQGWERQ